MLLGGSTGPAAAAVEAPYYVGNFETLLETLRQRDGDLLEGEESRFIARFFDLPLPARALLVRMAMRRGDLFRSSRLAYREIPDLNAALAPLLDLGWVDANPSLSIAEIFRLFRHDEIRGIPALGRPMRDTSKAQRLEALRGEFPQPLPRHTLGLAREGIYRLIVDALCERLRGMFFGNFRQELSEFVLADLGIFRYESVTLERASRPFASRAHVDAFLALNRCREWLREGRPPAEIERELPPPVTHGDWLDARRDTLCFRLGREWERRGDLPAALRRYADCADPEAQARALRLRATAGAVAGRTRRPAASPIPTFELELTDAGGGRGVEYRVRDSLESAAPEECSVHFVENGLINALFGLLCWPAIFAPVRGAFFHPFHQGPADLACAGFFTRRRREFSGCFEELHTGVYKTSILARYSEKCGIFSPFVAWGLIDEALLHRALDCIPSAHLLTLFEWIVKDVRSNRSGFPDLVQFWPQQRTYRLIEVKGPGDRLQDNQRRCLQHCLDHGIPVSVCRVRRAPAGVAVSSARASRRTHAPEAT